VDDQFTHRVGVITPRRQIEIAHYGVAIGGYEVPGAREGQFPEHLIAHRSDPVGSGGDLDDSPHLFLLARGQGGAPVRRRH
jgi:hypothetical protein